MKKITAAKPLDGFRLWLRFSDGFEGTVDLSDLAGQGVFLAWNTPGLFARVTVTEFGAVAWDDQIDLCHPLSPDDRHNTARLVSISTANDSTCLKSADLRHHHPDLIFGS